jgi:phosphonate transport system permease protein
MALTLPRRPWLNPTLGWMLALFLAVGLSLQLVLRDGWDLLNPVGWPQLVSFLTAAFQPDLSHDLLQIAAQATLVTLGFAVCGTTLSLLLGLLGGILCSEVWWLTVAPRHPPRWLWLSLRGGLAFPRAIHELLWGLFFINIFGLDPLVGVVAIALPFGAIMAKVFSEILDDTPRAPLQSLVNSGVPAPIAFLYGLLPQAALHLISYSFYRFECSLRSAAVLGVIGAGGLGYEILLSLQSLKYRELWTFFYALILLNGLVDWASGWFRQRWGCGSRLDLNQRPGTVRSLGRLSGDPWLWLASLGGLVLVPICFWVIQANWSRLWAAKSGQNLVNFLRELWPPNFAVLWEQDWGQLSTQTLAMAILAIALAAVGGILLAFPAATNSFTAGGLLNPNPKSSAWGSRLALVSSRVVLLTTRTIPAPIWALVVLFVVYPGVLPGAIALGLHNLGILGRLMAEVIENLDPRALQALRAQGTPTPLVFTYGILPLSLPRFLSYSLYRWEVCMRETVTIGVVGAGGLGLVLKEQLSSFDYASLIVTLGVFVLLTFGVDLVSTLARRSLR